VGQKYLIAVVHFVKKIASMKILTKTGTYTEINDNLYNLVKDKPKARERRFNARTVAMVLQLEHPLMQQIPLDKLEQYIKESKTLSRQWRKLLEEKPEFRGSDYGDKAKLEQKKMIELGY
jgi:hypothetical protein